MFLSHSDAQFAINLCFLTPTCLTTFFLSYRRWNMSCKLQTLQHKSEQLAEAKEIKSICGYLRSTSTKTSINFSAITTNLGVICDHLWHVEMHIKTHWKRRLRYKCQWFIQRNNIAGDRSISMDSGDNSNEPLHPFLVWISLRKLSCFWVGLCVTQPCIHAPRKIKR